MRRHESLLWPLVCSAVFCSLGHCQSITEASPQALEALCNSNVTVYFPARLLPNPDDAGRIAKACAKYWSKTSSQSPEVPARRLLFSIPKRSAPQIIGVVPTPEVPTESPGTLSSGSTNEANSTAAKSGGAQTSTAAAKASTASTAVKASGTISSQRADSRTDNPVKSIDGTAGVKTSTASQQGAQSSSVSPVESSNSTAKTENATASNWAAQNRTANDDGSTSSAKKTETSTSSTEGAKSSATKSHGSSAGTAKSEISTAKSETSTAKSETSTAKSEISTAKSETSTAKSETSTANVGVSKIGSHGSTASGPETPVPGSLQTSSANSSGSTASGPETTVTGSPKTSSASSKGSSSRSAGTEAGNAGSGKQPVTNAAKSKSSTSKTVPSETGSGSTGEDASSAAETDNSPLRSAKRSGAVGTAGTVAPGAIDSSAGAESSTSGTISTGEHKVHMVRGKMGWDRTTDRKTDPRSGRESDSGVGITTSSGRSYGKSKRGFGSSKGRKASVLGAVASPDGTAVREAERGWDAKNDVAGSVGTPDASAPAAEVTGAPTPGERKVLQYPVPGVLPAPAEADLLPAVAPLARDPNLATGQKPGFWGRLWRWAKPGKKQAAAVQSSGMAGEVLPRAAVATGAPGLSPEAGDEQEAGQEAASEAAGTSVKGRKGVLPALQDREGEATNRSASGVLGTEASAGDAPVHAGAALKASESAAEKSVVLESARGPGSKAREVEKEDEESGKTGSGVSSSATPQGLLRWHPWGSTKAKAVPQDPVRDPAAEAALSAKFSSAEPPGQATGLVGALGPVLLASKDRNAGPLQRGTAEGAQDGVALADGLPEQATASDAPGKAAAGAGGGKKKAAEALAMPSALLVKSGASSAQKAAGDLPDSDAVSQKGLAPAGTVKSAGGKKLVLGGTEAGKVPLASLAVLRDADGEESGAGRDIKARSGMGTFRKEKKKKRMKKKAGKAAVPLEKGGKKNKKKSGGKAKKTKATVAITGPKSQKQAKSSRRNME
eukprot:jgi/Botrbrau1/3743/Bobra.0363s0022.1